MNKYLDLAERVLIHANGMLTARQIWDIAVGLDMIKDANFGKTPWVTLGRMLASEVKHHAPSIVFASTAGTPTYYFLKGSDTDVDRLHYIADMLESDGLNALLKRVRGRPPMPTAHLSQSKVYDRDPNLVAYVRLRAKHCCDLCGKEGFSKDNGHLYIEVHHLKRLADGGEDTPENAAAVCADCHRRLHHSVEKEELLVKLRSKIAHYAMASPE